MVTRISALDRPSVPTVSADDAELLEFSTRWYRHGGGAPTDIWQQFGLAPREYFDRVLHAVDAHGDHLPASTRQGIRAVARRRLWLAA